MNAIGVSEYGPIDNLRSQQLPEPAKPTGRQLIVQVKGISVNPIDIKVRDGSYDDAPDYYERAKPLTMDANGIHVMGYDGSGIVTHVGPDVRYYKPGDEIFYLGSIVGQGCYAEQQTVDERHAGRKPRSLDWVQAAAMPLTWATAYESIVTRLGVQKNEQAGMLIINGGGGMGSIACQLARHYLKLPVVITTASRPETEAFSRDMGATHVVNHREDIAQQIRDLQAKGDIPADIPIKYAYITSRTEQYIQPIADILVPFGKVCSIVQAKFDMYGTQFMSKSLTFVWCWLGSGAYHGYVNDDQEKHHEWYEELAQLVDDGALKCHLTKRAKLTLENVKEAHRLIESGKAVGKMGLGVDEPGEGHAFL
jgi:zinc-binding alcohol dehydrogenase family protein